MRPINIASFKNKKLIKNLKIDKAKYDRYKYKFLTSKNIKNQKKANYEIIGDLMNKYI